MRPPVRLWLARHGATAWNEAGRFTGWADPGLSRQGRAQARALGSELRGRCFDSVWTSDLRRAIETATIALLAAGLRLELNIDRRLRELRFGAIEGSRWGDLPPQVRRELLLFEGFRARSGESVEELGSRVRGFIDSLPPGDHLVVTHGGVIRVLMRDGRKESAVPPGSMMALTLTCSSR